jgi:hypothetical protein
MISKTMQHASSVLLCITLFAAGAQAQQTDSSQAQTSTQSSQVMSSYSAPTVAPMTSDQLDALVAPIALYPDALVAQVLGAAAAPDQVSAAALWLAQNNSLTGTALAQAVDQQTWDPSIKALTQFPDVLNNLAGNLGWTSELGQAFQNQQGDVMAAVQVMRAKAQAAGTLQSTPQINVVQQSPQTIVIQPADPDVVYVPQYNPTVVYGTPYVVPLYTPRVVVAAPVVSYGPAIRIGVAFGGGSFVGGGGFVGGGFAWGWHSWNCNWGGGGGGSSVVYQHNTYIHNTTYINNHTTYNNYHPWGPGPHGPGPYGPHPYNPNGFQPNGGGYRPNGGNEPNSRGYRPNVNGNSANGGGYRPNGGGYGPNNGPNGDRHVPGDVPNGDRNGDRGLIGGNGGVQHQPNGDDRRPGSFGGNQARNHMSGDGPASRAESNRGQASMNRGASHPVAHRQPAMRAQAPHSPAPRGGGRGRG